MEKNSLLCVLLGCCIYLTVSAPSCTTDSDCSSLGFADPVCEHRQCFDYAWPKNEAQYQGRIEVSNVVEPDPSPALGGGGSIENIIRGGPDLRWLHIHDDDGATFPANISIFWLDGCQNSIWRHGDGSPWNSGAGNSGTLSAYQIRYVAGEDNTPISSWLDYPYQATLDASNFAALDAGIYHISFEMQNGPSPENFRPYACFLHLRKAGAVSTRVPLGMGEQFKLREPGGGGVPEFDYCTQFSSHHPYMDSNDRQHVGYPVNSQLEAFLDFEAARLAEELWLEPMSPRTPLFYPLQMWWRDPAQDNLPFVRSFSSFFDETAKARAFQYFAETPTYQLQTMRVQQRHERFPARDGPRGVGWMSSYAGGQIDSQGRFAFAETSGRVAYLYPDGEIKTIAGLTTDPALDPVWFKKTTSAVRGNMVLRGTWQNGQRAGEDGGFRLPMDVAVDPQDENILFVVGKEDHCIWRVQINSLGDECGSGHDVDVSVFAGSEDHSYSTPEAEVDGVGTAATFIYPQSIVFDSVCDCMYVVSTKMGSLRRVSRDGTVTTLYGGTASSYVKFSLPWDGIEFIHGPPAYVSAYNAVDNEPTGPAWWFPETALSRDGIELEVETAAGTAPDMLGPDVVRVSSTGNIIVHDVGFGTIREINPTTNETWIRAHAPAQHQKWSSGWFWMAVDLTGNSGGQDGIYWTMFFGDIGPGNPVLSWQLPLGDFGGSGNAVVFESSAGGDDPNGACCSGCPQQHCPYNCMCDMRNEIMAWARPGSTGQSIPVWNNGNNYLSPMFGLVPQAMGPAHYGWLVAVDPRGGVLWGGAAGHGISRMRRVRSDDPIAINNDADPGWQRYWEGERVWKTGGNWQNPATWTAVPHNSIYNFNGFNSLGSKDAHATIGMTDNELLDYWDIPERTRQATCTSLPGPCVDQLLFYLRAATETTSTTPPTPPLPVDCGDGSDGANGSEAGRLAPESLL